MTEKVWTPELEADLRKTVKAVLERQKQTVGPLRYYQDLYSEDRLHFDESSSLNQSQQLRREKKDRIP